MFLLRTGEEQAQRAMHCEFRKEAQILRLEGQPVRLLSVSKIVALLSLSSASPESKM